MEFLKKKSYRSKHWICNHQSIKWVSWGFRLPGTYLLFHLVRCPVPVDTDVSIVVPHPLATVLDSGDRPLIREGPECLIWNFQNGSRREHSHFFVWSLRCESEPLVIMSPVHWTCFLPNTLQSAVGKETERDERQEKVALNEFESLIPTQLCEPINFPLLFKFVSLATRLLFSSWPRTCASFEVLRIVFSFLHIQDPWEI